MRYLLALLLIPSIALADIKTFTWDAPTTNADGSPAVVTGYKLYISSSSGAYGSLPAATVTETTAVVTITTVGKYFAVVRAANGAGESANSNEVTFDVLQKLPRAPANFKVE